MSMTNGEMIAVLQAHHEGILIQVRKPDGKWEDCRQDPAFFFPAFDRLEYRIKPEPPKPREFYLRFSCASKQWIYTELKSNGCDKCETIHVREVLPNEEGKA